MCVCGDHFSNSSDHDGDENDVNDESKDLMIRAKKTANVCLKC